jgi:NADH dehydrogenase FAD-containing subunit
MDLSRRRAETKGRVATKACRPVDPKLKLYSDSAASFSPEKNQVALSQGGTVNYDHLIVAPGASTLVA